MWPSDVFPLLYRNRPQNSKSLGSVWSIFLGKDVKYIFHFGSQMWWKVKSQNQDSNPGPLAYHLRTPTTELLRPNVLTDIYTSVSLVSQALGKSKLSKQIKNITWELGVYCFVHFIHTTVKQTHELWWWTLQFFLSRDFNNIAESFPPSSLIQQAILQHSYLRQDDKVLCWWTLFFQKNIPFFNSF